MRRKILIPLVFSVIMSIAVFGMLGTPLGSAMWGYFFSGTNTVIVSSNPVVSYRSFLSTSNIDTTLQAQKETDNITIANINGITHPVQITYYSSIVSANSTCSFSAADYNVSLSAADWGNIGNNSVYNLPVYSVELLNITTTAAKQSCPAVINTTVLLTAS
jgi:hypothetical protein